MHLDLIPAIVRLLTDLASSQPLLLVLGDLHQADAFSLDLVRYLAQLAVKRPGQMLEAVTRERLCQQIELGCLLRRDCDELVRAMDPGSTVGPELAAQIYQWSRGNPLFVEELVRELQRQAEPGAERGPGRIPDGQPSWSAANVPARVRALTDRKSVV